MGWTIEFAPLIPVVLLWAGAAAALALIAFFFVRRMRGATLRLASLALLLLTLANPSLKQVEREALDDVVIVVSDESASQRVAGRQQLSQTLREALEAKLEEIPGVEARFVKSPGSTGTTPRDGTLLFADLGRAVAEVPANQLAGVILITDGQIHDVPGAIAELGLDIPIHALLTGQPGEFDRRLEVVKSPRFGIVGGSRNAEVRVVDSGREATGETVKLRLQREGEGSETRRVKIGETVQIPMRFPHSGMNIVELEVEGAEGELTPTNNRAILAAEGVRENLRVLLVSGEPHAGERVWRNLLKSDAAVDLVHFTILRPPEKQDGTPINQLSLIAFPTRELFSEKLEDFDLIIFDRYHRRGVLPLLYLDNVASYVENGGAVLVASGEHYASPTSLYRTPLSHILPATPTGRVIEEPYRPMMTQVGNRHPVTRGLIGSTGQTPSWGRWFRIIETIDTQGSVLMEGPRQTPLLILNRQGEGRIALLLSDHAWLWARGFEGGGPYTDLLRRLAHWLMKEPDLEEDSLQVSSRGNDLIIERHSMQEQIEPIELTAPSGEKSQITLERSGPGVWRGTIAQADQGIYRAKSGDLTGVAHVGQVSTREYSRLTASDELLASVLEATGGGAFWMGSQASQAAPELPRIARLRSGSVMHGSDWMGLKRRDAALTKGRRLIPLFAGFAALALLLGAIAATWFREGR